MLASETALLETATTDERLTVAAMTARRRFVDIMTVFSKRRGENAAHVQSS